MTQPIGSAEGDADTGTRPYTTPAGPPRRHRLVLIRDLVLGCRIGIHRHERNGTQRVRFNLELTVIEETGPPRDDLSTVVCYDTIIQGIRRMAAAEHVNLVETLAERLAGLCLQDRRVRSARIRVEKLDVYPDAASVGVEIERANPSPAPEIWPNA
jgi:dihydroneopterin aldolase